MLTQIQIKQKKRQLNFKTSNLKKIILRKKLKNIKKN